MSTASLTSGISGLKTSQISLNVIGNNLANLNTSGFKSSRVSFANSLSETMKAATAPSNGIGGTNPIQIGTGTKVSSIDRNFTQGNMTPTARPFDLAIDGDGMFMLSDGSQNYFTRVGTFNLDKNNDLVDSGTGFKVMGTSGVAINVPVNDTQPGKATTSTQISGNLNSEFTAGAVNHVLTGGSAYSVQGTGTTRTLTGSITPIASTTVTGVGTAFSTELAVGDQINIGGQIRKVTAIASNTSLTVDAATTVAVADAALTAGTGALTGSVTTTASTTVTGSGTAFTTELAVGDQITVNNETQTITAIASDTSLTVGTAYTATGTDTSAMTDSMAVAGLNDLLNTVNTTDYVTGDVIN
ncbi:MAG: flagellar hook-basal body complex protein, partial [Candidatus Scalindua sp.]|nr:flagellar hook-basal body complex protein [Candidatus Scalindua sp.]